MGTQDFPRIMPNHEKLLNAKVLIRENTLISQNVVKSATLKGRFLRKIPSNTLLRPSYYVKFHHKLYHHKHESVHSQGSGFETYAVKRYLSGNRRVPLCSKD